MTGRRFEERMISKFGIEGCRNVDLVALEGVIVDQDLDDLYRSLCA